MSHKPNTKRCCESGRGATHGSFPFLFSGLLLIPSMSLADNDVSAAALATVSKSPPPTKPSANLHAKGKAAIKVGVVKAQPVLLPPRPSGQGQPINAANQLADKSSDKTGAYRPYIEVSGLGLLIGDYQIQPRLVLGTDNRLDDANIRERALRDDLDAMEARKRGEIKEDPITFWLRTRGQNGLPGVDPGFQVAYAIQNVLRGSVKLPPMLEYAPPGRTYSPPPPTKR